LNQKIESTFDAVCLEQGIAGLDYWIAQSGLQSNLMNWIVIDNPKSKLDLDYQSKSKI